MKVLLVDDDPAFLLVAAHLLRADGRFEVREALGPEAGLAAARAERPDAVVSDFRMDGMDGLELMARMRALDGMASLPFVFCTGKQDAALRERALAAGARGFLPKAVDPSAFGPALHACLAAEEPAP